MDADARLKPGTAAAAASDAGRGSNAIALLALAVAAGATAAVSFLTVNRLKDAVIDASLHGRPIGIGTLLAPLGMTDAAAMALAATSILLLIWLEASRRAYSRLLATASSNDAAALLLILTAWFGHAYLNPGVLLGGDTGTHIARFLEVRRGLDAGALPFWTNYQYAGAPLLWFTGPLTYVVGGGLDVVLRDAVLTAKVLLFALHVLGGVLFFAWLRRLDIAPVAAALAAAAFAGSFAHLHLFLYRGVFPQAFTIVFVVLLFHAADGLFRGRGARWANVLILGLATAGLIVNHQPHALFAALYLGLFGAVALATGFWQWRALPWVAAAGVAGAVASAIAVLPVVVEADWVMIEPEGGMARFQLPTLARLLHLVVWRNTRTTWGVDYWAYLGLGAVVFGLAGVVGLLRGRLRPGQRGAALPALICLAACFFLWNPVVRDVLFLLLFLALLAGIGLDWLIASRILAGRLLLAAAVVMVADLASTSVQPVARTDKGFMIAAGQRIEQIAPQQRFVALNIGFGNELEADIGPDGGPVSYASTVQRVAGNHNMAATRLHNYLVTVAKQAAAELEANGVLTPETQAALGVFNVGRIICASPTANGCPAWLRDTSDDPVLGRFVPVDATPVLFSRTLAPYGPDPGLAKPMLWPDDFHTPASQPRIRAIEAAMRDFLRIEQPDLTTRTAAAIAVQDPVPRPPDNDAKAPWHPVLLSYAVGLDTVRLSVEADQPGYVQLAHPWFPSMRATINGQPVQPIRGSIDLMVLPIPAGRSVIELHDGWTPVRMISAVISGAGLLLIAGLAVAAGRGPAPKGRSRYRPAGKAS